MTDASRASGSTAAAAHAHGDRASLRIGGPGTRLPTLVESLLAWSLCLSCLGVSGYHYVASTFLSPSWSYLRLRWDRVRSQTSDDDDQHVPLPYERCWIPLTTHSRAELDRATPRERHDELVKVLETLLGKEDCSDDVLVLAIRCDEVCRRLASLAMRPYPTAAATTGGRSKSNATTTLLREDPELKLVQRLARLWPTLLALPPAKDPAGTSSSSDQYDISLVLPAFGEDGHDINLKLTRARLACIDPGRVEVVLVDAGGCRNLDVVVELQEHQGGGGGGDGGSSSSSWGRVVKINFTTGGGRGPCLNEGACESTGRVLTFCHSDTQLPDRWDASVIKAFETQGGGDDRRRSNSCAFSFGINTTPEGLNGGAHPPGMGAVEATANLRTHLYSLPYGDQCVSVPADVFRFLGGFPDQCLMEDYELVALLRKRAALLHKFGITDREQVAIIGGEPALCSPRRWQRFGVLYVTYMNSTFVNLYVGGMSPDDLFRLYYGASPPKRDCDLSPWEIEMSGVVI